MDDAAEDVARQIVGPEKMPLRQRGQEAFGAQVAPDHRVIGRDHVREDRDKDEKQDDAKPDHRQPVGPEGKPGPVDLPQARLAARLRLVGQKPFTAR